MNGHWRSLARPLYYRLMFTLLVSDWLACPSWTANVKTSFQVLWFITCGPWTGIMFESHSLWTIKMTWCSDLMLILGCPPLSERWSGHSFDELQRKEWFLILFWGLLATRDFGKEGMEPVPLLEVPWQRGDLERGDATRSLFWGPLDGGP
jgi:hypothetical protein